MLHSFLNVSARDDTDGSDIIHVETHRVSRRQVIGLASLLSAGAVVGDLTGLIGKSMAARADTAWGGYQNGRIPSSALTSVPADIGPYLRSDAAADYFKFSDAFRSRFGKALGITEAYRDYARQEYLYDQYVNHGGNLAAYPGSSVHGWALACDFKSGVNQYGTAEKSWADAHGPSYNWYPTGNGFSQREPWHFEYKGQGNPPSTTSETGDDDVEIYFRRVATGECAVFGGSFKPATGGASGRHIFGNQAEYDRWRLILNTYNGQIDSQGLDPRGKRFVPPASLSDIVGVGESDWAIICGLFGV